jgi:hypothetical protein
MVKLVLNKTPIINKFYENLFYKIVQGIYSVNIEKQLIFMRKFRKEIIG